MIMISEGKTRIKAFKIHLFPEGTQLLLPQKPVQFNQAATNAAYNALLCRQFIAGNERFIEEGQSNTFQYAELKWETPELEQVNFSLEHKESLINLWVDKNEVGR